MNPTKERGTKSGKPESPAAQLHAVWRGLSDDARDYWRQQLESSRSQADLRLEILAKFKIRLSYDNKLTQFRKWLADQDERDLKAQRAEENARRIQAEHPDWTLDQVRDEVIKQSYFETLASGDFKLGLKTVQQNLNVKRVAMDEAEVLESKKTDQAKALEMCLEEAKEFPLVQEMFRQAFDSLELAKAKAK